MESVSATRRLLQHPAFERAHPLSAAETSHGVSPPDSTRLASDSRARDELQPTAAITGLPRVQRYYSRANVGESLKRARTAP